MTTLGGRGGMELEQAGAHHMLTFKICREPRHKYTGHEKTAVSQSAIERGCARLHLNDCVCGEMRCVFGARIAESLEVHSGHARSLCLRIVEFRSCVPGPCLHC